MRRVIATYQSNYNGCSLEDMTLDNTDLCDHDDPTIRKAAERAVDRITDTLHGNCDDDGYYMGTDKFAIRVIVDAVHEFLGVDVDVVVKFDGVSS